MRYREIVASSKESEEETSARLEMMYGIGSTDAEVDEAELAALVVGVELDRAKATRLTGEALEGRAPTAANYSEADLDREFPWPTSGNRSLNTEERMAVWLRASRVAGFPLPILTTRNDDTDQ